LIAEKLPPLSGRPLELGELAPTSPLGSWTLLRPDLTLVAERCSSAFPNGEPPLAELKFGPPSRAYRKLWEAFVVMGRFPAPGDTAVDLGASPGGWTWLLAELGCRVVAVDRAPLDPEVADGEGVVELQTSAFGLSPSDVHGGCPPAWVVADIACYPERLFPLIERWGSLEPQPKLIFTIKFQSPTDHEVTDRFRALPGARLVHLHHNKHELTLFVTSRVGISR
jgi:23S rRNA (cytidine2498-2'-O)-methyltransferase